VRLFEGILARDSGSIARALTLVETGDPRCEGLLDALYPRRGNARIWGITGPPGSGKSTLIERLISRERGQGRRVAVVAVDPSSPLSGGALLGDRLRMQTHAGDPGVYIRSMASRGHLGGLALATSGAVTILDAAGFDTIMVETVGTGQSEVEVMDLADAVILVLVPGLGDDIQVLKAGIMEIGEIIVVNKKDRPGAEDLRARVQTVLARAGSPQGSEPKVLLASALENQGIDDLAAAVRDLLQRREVSGALEGRRRKRLSMELRTLFLSRLQRYLDAEYDLAARVAAWTDAVERGDASPHAVVAREIARMTGSLGSSR